MPPHILGFVGSLRADSWNRQLAQAALKHSDGRVVLDLHDGIADIPFYNEDIDVPGEVPPSAVRLREAVARADGLLFFSPEYNGTMPAVLKNTIDWLSRPWGDGVIKGKSVAVVGAAFGRYGGVWAHQDVRKSAGIAGGVVVEDAELSVGDCWDRFSATPPADDPEVVAALTAVFARLAATAAR